LRRTLMRTPGLLHLKQVEQLLLSHHMLGAVLAACNAPGQIVRGRFFPHLSEDDLLISIEFLH